MEELLGMCDCNPRIFKRSPKLPSINRSIKKIKKQDDDNGKMILKEIKPNEKIKIDHQVEKTVKKNKDADNQKIGEEKENRIIRRRKRKNTEQLKMLYNEYKKNPNWNKSMLADMAQKTGLSEAQIYKWSWDQKKKKTDEI